MKRLLVLLITIQLLVLSGCSSSSSKKDDADTEFLLGSWFAKEASYAGTQLDPEELFDGTFHLYFDDNGECTMAIDQNRAIVKWEYTGDGVTLTGDDTYKITFPDDSKERLIIVVNNIDILMEKYED